VNLWRVKLQAGQQLRVSKFPPEQRRAFPLVIKYNLKIGDCEVSPSPEEERIIPNFVSKWLALFFFSLIVIIL
jgi:hypothetical protein